MLSWWQNSIFYHIYPLGFFNCPEINPIAIPNHTLSQIQPVNRLAKIRRYYPHFQKLNIDAIYFGPIFESCTHGYDTIDYCQIDRRLGTNQLFKEIVQELHRLNIKVVVDAVFNHTSRLFPAFIDLKKNQENSPFLSWYKKIDFSTNTVWQDGFGYDFYQDCVELPTLNTDNICVQNHFFKTVHFWFQEFKIDGLRLDVAYLLKPNFLKKIRLLTTDLKPDSVLIGELMTPSQTKLINKNLLHTGTNFPLFQHLHQSFTQKDFWQLKQIFSQQDNLFLFNFLNNHDTDRIFSLLESYPDLQSAFVILFTTPGQPCLYYGDEILFDGLKKSKQDRQVRKKMINTEKLTKQQKNHLSFIQKITTIRQVHPFLASGQIKIISCHHEKIAYITHSQNQYLLTIINTNPNSNLILHNEFFQSNFFQDVFSLELYQANNGQLSLPNKNFYILKPKAISS